MSTASIEAQKALARGLKEEIEGVFPEIAGLNDQQAKLLNLQPALEKAVRTIANQDPIPGAGDLHMMVLKKVFDARMRARLAIALENAPELSKSKGVSVAGRLALIDSRVQHYLDAANGQSEDQQ